MGKNMPIVHQEGHTVFKFAERKTVGFSEKVLAENGSSTTDVELLTLCQGSRRIIDATMGWRSRKDLNVT